MIELKNALKLKKENEVLRRQKEQLLRDMESMVFRHRVDAVSVKHQIKCLEKINASFLERLVEKEAVRTSVGIGVPLAEFNSATVRTFMHKHDNGIMACRTKEEFHKWIRHNA